MENKEQQEPPETVKKLKEIADSLDKVTVKGETPAGETLRKFSEEVLLALAKWGQ